MTDENSPKKRKPVWTDKDWLWYADHLMEQTAMWERHQRLGHFVHLDGNKTANELRNTAKSIIDKYS